MRTRFATEQPARAGFRAAAFWSQIGFGLLIVVGGWMPRNIMGAGGTFGPPDGQGVFDVMSSVPAGHGPGFFELSTDSAFGWDVVTEAGAGGVWGAVDGELTAARFDNPGGVASDSLGNLYVVDSGNNRIRMIRPGGIVTTIAGSTFGFADGQGVSARFAFPTGIAVGPHDGHLYVSDTYNNRIRKLTRPAVEGQPWVVTTIAGGSTAGYADANGSSARFNLPQGLVVDLSGQVFVADSGNHRIRRITALGVVTTLAGSGTSGFANGEGATARFDSPGGVALDSAGNLYVADRGNHRIRKVLPSGLVSTYAGSGVPDSVDGTVFDSAFYSPAAVVIDAHDTIYVADEGSHKVRRITPPTRSPFVEVQTVAGDGVAGFVNGRAGLARLDHPAGMTWTANGDLLVADSENHCLRRLVSPVKVEAVGNPALPQVKATIRPVALGVPPGVYYFRWRALDWTVENDGLSRLITTVTPIALTIEADPVNAGEAVLRGLVNPRNLPVTALRFEVAPAMDFAASQMVGVTPTPGGGNADVPFSGVFSYPVSAAPGTAFYFRAIAVNDYGTSVSSEVFSFEVPGAMVVTEAVTDALTTRYEAQLNATANPKGSPMAVRFEYSTEPGLVDSWLAATIAPAVDTSGARGAAVDGAGHVFFSRQHLHRIQRFPAGLDIGGATPGFVNGDFASARFDRPAGVVLWNPDGATKFLVVCDEFNHCLRKVDLISGMVSTLAGSGVAGYADGTPAAARFLYPQGLAVDAAGHVYVADTGNHCVRKVTMSGGAAAQVETVAGINVEGQLDGASTVARFRSPAAVACGAGGVLYVADTGNHRVCKLESGEVSTMAGGSGAGFADATGAEARFSSPSGLALDSAGRLLVADRDNHRIRRIDLDGKVRTLAGSGARGVLDSPAAVEGLIPGTATRFALPNGIVAAGGDEFLITGGAEESALRKISPGSIRVVIVEPDLSGHGEQVISEPIAALSPGTTYYYRAVGDNRMDGTIEGAIRSFTTYSEPVIAVHAGATIADPLLAPGQLEPVSFGVMARHTVTTREFTVANLGGWPLTLGSVVVPAGYELTGGLGLVPAGGALTFSVRLTATNAAVFSGELVIASDDPDVPLFRFPLWGKKVDPPMVLGMSLRDLTIWPSSATLEAEINPNGADTSVTFEVSPGPDFEAVRVTTVAGGVSGYQDARGTASRFDRPLGLTADAPGNVYAADSENHRIRRITPTGVVSTFAGTGVAGFLDGPVTIAQFDRPLAVAAGPGGTLYVADNHRVRVITGGVVMTLAGTGEASFTDGLGSAARFHTPSGLAVAGNGDLYVADKTNRRIRRVTASGEVSTVALLAAPAEPAGLAIGPDGDLFVVDAGTHRVLRVTPGGVVSVFAGSGAAGHADAAGAAAQFYGPEGIAFDAAAQAFYIADRGNQRVRKVDLLGAVSTLAGSGQGGALDGPGPLAEFDEPVALTVTQAKTVMVSQLGGSALRLVAPTLIKASSADVLTESGLFSLPVSGLNPGVIHYVRVVVSSVGGTVVSSPILLGTPYTQWQIDHFGPNAVNQAVSGPGASPSGDRVPNLMKFALGLDPNTRSHEGLPVLRVNHPSSGFFSLTVQRNPAATNVRVFFEGSTDQSDWSEEGVQISGDNVGYLPYKDVPKRFLRAGFELILP